MVAPMRVSFHVGKSAGRQRTWYALVCAPARTETVNQHGEVVMSMEGWAMYKRRDTQA